MKTVDIFYKSYDKDFRLLNYSLQSLLKNVTGYNEIIVLIPSDQADQFNVVEKWVRDKIIVRFVEEYGSGYLFQQVCKLNAYTYSDADFILFSDSDLIFDHQINLQDYIVNNKPEILYTDYNKVENAIIWKAPTEKFIGEEVLWEGMRRNALIYHRETLINISNFCPDLEKQIMSSDRFSEFNAMFAYAHKFERDKYNFVNTDNWEYVSPKAIQLWSWADDNYQDEPHPYEYARSLEVINKTLGLNLTEI